MREINRLSNFSKRTDWNTEESDLARAHRERLAKGLPVVDLTASNPTRCGFNYASGLLEPLSDPRAFDYDPDPRGSRSARLAVCNYYADQGIRVSADDIILTVSTSEAYSYLLKLLCNPGDAILVPQPSYPLFDFLADAEVVGLVSAPLIYDHGWQIDMEGLRQAITERTRAVVLVHPNNPTGHYTKAEEGRELAAVCRERGLALIVDEVFLDYGLDFGLGYEGVEDGGSEARTSFAGRELDVLTFVVSGLSKICGLPQMKSSWLLAKGPGAAEALARLEVLADTYLSMNAPVQLALPVWLAGREAMQKQIRGRVRANLEELDRQLAEQERGHVAVNRLRVEGGWYAVLRIPAIQPDEVTALELLEAGVWVHPGHFFGMAGSGWIVVSLLTETEDFSLGIKVVLEKMRGTI